MKIDLTNEQLNEVARQRIEELETEVRNLKRELNTAIKKASDLEYRLNARGNARP